MVWTVQDVINQLAKPHISECEVPPYMPFPLARYFGSVGMTTGVNQHHMTDEAHQLFKGLEHAGYFLCGYDTPNPDLNTHNILQRFEPTTVVVQDKREWEGLTAGKDRSPKMKFQEIEVLRRRPDVFKLTVLKDAQNNPSYHKASADEIGCHAWIVYYHPKIVAHVAPFVRKQHLIRVYHSLDSSVVPEYSDQRAGALLSGALSPAYPLRKRLYAKLRMLPETTHLPHPGYHRKGCQTPEYIRLLSQFKVAICTSSMYGYSLRRIFEATAAGCMVLTDLPADDVLPKIDGNLSRIPGDSTAVHVACAIRQMLANYKSDRQEHYAELAKSYYDYRAAGLRLAADIEDMRNRYVENDHHAASAVSGA